MDTRTGSHVSRVVSIAAGSALAVHLIEVGFAASAADNALLDALATSDRLRYLLLVVAAFPATALPAALLALVLGSFRKGLAAPAAALVPGLLVGFEVLRHADELRGKAGVVFGCTAIALGLLGALASIRGASAAGATRTRLAPWLIASVAAVLVLLLLRSPPGVAPAQAATQAPPSSAAASNVAPARNLLVLLVDTLRADHLGCYGYERETSPRIDALAREGTLFENAATPKPKTSPAVASLFTGTWPQSHRIHDTSTELSEEQVTLAEVLQANGFRTFGVAANINISEVFGFDQGFADFVQIRANKDLELPREAERLRDAFLEWLDESDERPDDRWFAYLHFIAPHSFYRAPEPFLDMFRGDGIDGHLGAPDLPVSSDCIDSLSTSVYQPELGNDLDRYVVRYDGEIRFADTVIGEILDALDARGLRDSTAVAFTSDHGETLTGHHIYFTHGLYPYEGEVRIPLVVRGPGLAAGVRRTEQVSLVGLMPTLLDLVAVPVPERVEERPFTELLEVGTPRGEGTPTFISSRSGPLVGTHGVRTNRWKYMERRTGSRPAQAFRLSHLLIPGKRVRHDLGGLRDYELTHELYDLQTDPDEQDNLAWRLPEVREQLAGQLASFHSRAAPVGRPPRLLDYRELDADVGEELRQLGYIDH